MLLVDHQLNLTSNYEAAMNRGTLRSHHCGSKEDLTLFHVYDIPLNPSNPDERSKSQTPHVENCGIVCGASNISREMLPRLFTSVQNADKHLVTEENIIKHLDWANREPTHFISLWDRSYEAFRDAERRRSHFRLEGIERSVRSAEISATELDKARMFYFSKAEIGAMLQLPPSSRIFTEMHDSEWLVVRHVPAIAVKKIHALGGKGGPDLDNERL